MKTTKNETYTSAVVDSTPVPSQTHYYVSRFSRALHCFEVHPVWQNDIFRTMSLQTQIRYSKEIDLTRDLAKYRQAIEDNQFPEMIPHWRETVSLIEHELDQRCLLASVVTGWAPNVIDVVPF